MNRRALLIAGAAGLVIVLLWYFLLWTPRNSDLEAAQARRSTAEAQKLQLTAELARLKAARQDEPAKRARLEILKAAIPDQPALAEFILDANDAANRAGIDFLSISQSPPPAASVAPGGAPNAVTLSFAITGGYFQVLDYINRISALPRLVAIEAVALSPAETVAGVQRLSASITAKMFTSGGLVATPPSTLPPPGATTTTAPGATTTTAAP